jgi:hypothetical protein
VQKHLKFKEDLKPQAFKLFWKTAAKAGRQFRFQLRRDFIRKIIGSIYKPPIYFPRIVEGVHEIGGNRSSLIC